MVKGEERPRLALECSWAVSKVDGGDEMRVSTSNVVEDGGGSEERVNADKKRGEVSRWV